MKINTNKIYNVMQALLYETSLNLQGNFYPFWET